MANKTANETAVLVIDVQNCFLPKGSLATINKRNDPTSGINELGKKIAEFVNAKNPTHLFVSKDWHTPGHSSFTQKGETGFLEALRTNNPTNGINLTRYANRTVIRERKWGEESERKAQKRWPEHCVQGTPGAELDVSFSKGLTYANKVKQVTILKGDKQETDSYSAVADALGDFTPHTPDGRAFMDILKKSNINELYITGIARDVCVFWTALDLLEFWILPAYNEGKTIKLIFMYNLTRPVNSGSPWTNKTPDQINAAVSDLIQKMGMDPSIMSEVFEIRGDGENYSFGGHRKKARTMKRCKKSNCHKKRCHHNCPSYCKKRRHTKRR